MKGLAPPTLPLVATPSNEGVSRNLTPLHQLVGPKQSSFPYPPSTSPNAGGVNFMLNFIPSMRTVSATWPALMLLASNCASEPAGQGGVQSVEPRNQVQLSIDAPQFQGSSKDSDLKSRKAIYSGVPWLDTAGNLLNAHGIGILKVGSTYYMVGEKRTDKNDATCGGNPEDLFVGINMYSSTDLTSWTYVGTPIVPDSGSLLSSSLIGERPKLYYNSSTNKYFILVKTMKSGGTSNHYVISSADNVTGPYTYIGALMYGRSNPATGDVNVFVDSDGAGYLIAPDGKIYKLSSDYLSVASVAVSNVWGSAVPWRGYCQSEGPGFFKAGNTYFLLGSHGTFWNANDNFYATAPSITGPWTYRGLFTPSGTMTWNSQSGFVLPVSGSSGTTYIYMGDRWVNSHLTSSGLVWQPINVRSNFMFISSYTSGWTLDVETGTWSALNTTDSGTTVNDNETGTGQNQFNYAGKWSHDSSVGSYSGDVTTSSTTDSSVTIAFTGTQIFLYSLINNSNMGIMGVTLQDSAGNARTPEEYVSLRTDASQQGNYLVYTSPVMPIGAYVLKVRATGLKDHSSSGTTIAIDRVMVLGESGPGVCSGRADGDGRLIGLHSGRCLDVDGAMQTNGNRVQIYECHGGSNQQWTFNSAGEIRAFGNSNKCLNVANQLTAPGSLVDISDCNGGANQKWTMNIDGTIVGKQSGLCLDVKGEGTSNRAVVEIWTCNGGANQQWTP